MTPKEYKKYWLKAISSLDQPENWFSLQQAITYSKLKTTTIHQCTKYCVIKCLKLIIKTPEKSIVQTPPPPPLFLKGGSKFWLPSPEGGSEKLKKGVVV